MIQRLFRYKLKKTLSKLTFKGLWWNSVLENVTASLIITGKDMPPYPHPGDLVSRRINLRHAYGIMNLMITHRKTNG